MRILASLFLVAILALTAVAQDPGALPPQQVAEVHGIKIHYFDIGEKSSPVVLLLHGLGDRAANHLGAAGVLATRFRVIAPDRVGHGASDRPAVTSRARNFR